MPITISMFLGTSLKKTSLYLAIFGLLAVLVVGYQNCAPTLKAGSDSEGSSNVGPIITDILYEQISSGDGHDCVLSSDGSVKCWGNNNSGQLGNGTLNSSSVPVAVRNLGGIVEISSGGSSTCALDANGNPKCWGTLNSSSSPMAVQGLTGLKQISLGSSHACAITSQDTVVCWGNNNFGQLGNGTLSSSSSPVTVQNLAGVIQIVAGASHTCALTSQGGVKCWGSNYSGQLGNGTFSSSSSAVTVQNISGIKQIIAGSSHTCAITTQNAVTCWGYNGDGELGNGLLQNSNIPVTVQGATGITQIVAGTSHTCGLTTQDTVTCWGYNGSGQLAAPGLSDVQQISAGNAHTCALTSQGTISCWGQFVSVAPSVPSGCAFGISSPTYTNGVPIPANTVSCSSGSTPTLFSLAGTLPPGLSFNSSTGTISGTPSTVRTATSYSVTPSNSAGTGPTFTVTITVASGVTVPSGCSYSSVSPIYTRGTAIPANTVSCSGGSAPTGFSLTGTLPTGLSFNSSTGTISGTPTVLRTATTYSVTASNSAGNSTAFTLTMTVRDIPPSACSYTTATASYTVNTPITQNAITCSGGPVVSYSVGPALPAGLSLNTTTGAITGTPTTATSAVNYTVTATNTGGNTTAVVTITVAAGVTVPTGCSYSVAPAFYRVGVTITPNTVSCTGGSAPTAFSIDKTLTTGLLFNTSTGTISGTPQYPPPATDYFVTPSNSAGNGPTFSVRLNIGPALTPTPTPTPVPTPTPTPAPTISNVSATSTATTVTFQFNYTGSPTAYNIYLDTDLNTATGFSRGGIGADYLIQEGSTYRNVYVYSGIDGAWGWTDLNLVTITNSGGFYTATTNRSDIGSPPSVDVVVEISPTRSAIYRYTFPP